MLISLSLRATKISNFRNTKNTIIILSISVLNEMIFLCHFPSDCLSAVKTSFSPTNFLRPADDPLNTRNSFPLYSDLPVTPDWSRSNSVPSPRICRDWSKMVDETARKWLKPSCHPIWKVACQGLVNIAVNNTVCRKDMWVIRKFMLLEATLRGFLRVFMFCRGKRNDLHILLWILT